MGLLCCHRPCSECRNPTRLRFHQSTCGSFWNVNPDSLGDPLEGTAWKKFLISGLAQLFQALSSDDSLSSWLPSPSGNSASSHSSRRSQEVLLVALEEQLAQGQGGAEVFPSRSRGGDGTQRQQFPPQALEPGGKKKGKLIILGRGSTWKAPEHRWDEGEPSQHVGADPEFKDPSVLGCWCHHGMGMFPTGNVGKSGSPQPP